jgi:hypothetical protein
MRPVLFFLGIATGMVAFMLIKRTPPQDAATPQAAAQVASVPVVVELFTSEGCSSCPPADQLLAKLEADQPIKNVEIIALEEHVDYWNNGGWMDPFSSDSATIRQYAYAGAIGNGNAYTPQMVVDGQSEFVGSRERQARGAIEQAASRKKIEVSVTSGQYEADGTQTVHISIGPLAGSSGGDAPEIWLAITEAKLHSDVRGGENSGQYLHHASVVRKLKKIEGVKVTDGHSFSSEERVKFDRGWKRENTRVVVFVQEKKSKKILGAGSTTLPS